MSNCSAFGGSHIASKKEILEMLKLAAEKNVRPWVDQVLPMSEAGKAIQGVEDNKVSSFGNVVVAGADFFVIGPIPIRPQAGLGLSAIGHKRTSR
jgi:hypothetical protein